MDPSCGGPRTRTRHQDRLRTRDAGGCHYERALPSDPLARNAGFAARGQENRPVIIAWVRRPDRPIGSAVQEQTSIGYGDVVLCGLTARSRRGVGSGSVQHSLQSIRSGRDHSIDSSSGSERIASIRPSGPLTLVAQRSQSVQTNHERSMDHTLLGDPIRPAESSIKSRTLLIGPRNTAGELSRIPRPRRP